MEMPITFDLHIVQSRLTPHFNCITDTLSENVDWVQNLAILLMTAPVWGPNRPPVANRVNKYDV